MNKTIENKYLAIGKSVMTLARLGVHEMINEGEDSLGREAEKEFVI